MSEKHSVTCPRCKSIEVTLIGQHQLAEMYTLAADRPSVVQVYRCICGAAFTATASATADREVS